MDSVILADPITSFFPRSSVLILTHRNSVRITITAPKLSRYTDDCVSAYVRFSLSASAEENLGVHQLKKRCETNDAPATPRGTCPLVESTDPEKIHRSDAPFGMDNCRTQKHHDSSDLFCQLKHVRFATHFSAASDS
jgi:hypothetical protein